MVLDYFELSALGDSTLVDVATENELDSCGHEALQHEVSAAHGTLMCGTPRRCGEMMMKRRCPQRPRLGIFQLGYEALELG
jgi:hypothetical protein